MCVVSCSGIAIDGYAHTNTSSYSITSMQQSLVYWTHLLSCGPGDETNVLLDDDLLTRPCLQKIIVTSQFPCRRKCQQSRESSW